MKFFNLFRRQGSAPVARDRLQILLAHERSSAKGSDLLTVVREEILSIITKHVEIDPKKVSVHMSHGKKISTLEIEIEVPNNTQPLSGGSRKKRPFVQLHRPA
jgi:cell division topological specificity factor